MESNNNIVECSILFCWSIIYRAVYLKYRRYSKTKHFLWLISDICQANVPLRAYSLNVDIPYVALHTVWFGWVGWNIKHRVSQWLCVWLFKFDFLIQTNSLLLDIIFLIWVCFHNFSQIPGIFKYLKPVISNYGSFFLLDFVTYITL